MIGSEAFGDDGSRRFIPAIDNLRPKIQCIVFKAHLLDEHTVFIANQVHALECMTDALIGDKAQVSDGGPLPEIDIEEV